MSLHHYLAASAGLYPDHPAVEEAEEAQISYRALDALSDALRDRLRHLGVRPGDRVGIYLHKSIDSVAALFGILKAGGVYVPVDPTAPAARNAYILNNCQVKAIVVEAKAAEALRAALGELGEVPPLIVLGGTGGGRFLAEHLAELQAADPAPAVANAESRADELAYILYTSGSTGRPKGVMLSHGNGEAFVDWCSRTLAPWQEDRFSSHAPFHFDLSILDIYLSIKHGGTLVLVGEEVGKEPLGLATLIAEKKISIWYSAPSILGLMAQYGKLESRDYSHLRMVLFAGEVFPIVHLRSLARQWPAPRYFNLYGPTETNVCTSYEVTLPIPEQRSEPYPIGAVCDHLQGMVVDAEGNRLEEREEGELCIAGANVMRGYWNLPEQTGGAFIVDGEGRRWYRTGDIVVRQADGDYRYVGRRDRMVKRRGYRVELGEIEACLYRHGDVREAAVVAVMDGQTGVSIRAHLSLGAGGKPSLIAFKRFCSEHLPLYMVPDRFIFQPALPKTSTAKVDYESLKGMG